MLDISKPQKVAYCIPLWLRDEQIRVNSAAVAGRIQTDSVKRPDPIAVVCYGPSLNDTWEQIRQFPYIISCSGAHKFLIERGIIPTYHVEVDPRAHKIELLGPPHPDVEYLIASTCHPKYFEHLQGFNVKLWHVFDSEAEARRVLPRGEWALTGGSSVGLRAMTIARFLGFTEQHVFGMDGSEGPSGKHAASHPNQAKDSRTCEYEGVIYHTTPAMLECARQTWHELDQMPDVTATFYGDGLVQAMAKRYTRKATAGPLAIGFNSPELISPEYRALSTQLHRENLAYGVGGGKHAKTVLALLETLKKTSEHGVPSVLDYGCGKGYLAKALPFPIFEYDPAFPEKATSPRPADLVICADVLEHVEPDRLFLVLDDLRRCVKQVGYFVIHTGPASKTLADGRNTHLIQQGLDWWKRKLAKFFTIAKIIPKGVELHFLVAPHAKKKSATTLANVSPAQSKPVPVVQA